MVAFTKDICTRKTRIFGTRGQLEGDGHQISVFDFVTKEMKTMIPSDEEAHPNTRMSGHEYGDFYLMQDFVNAVARKDPSLILSTPQQVRARFTSVTKLTSV
jgi:hypothetical protein